MKTFTATNGMFNYEVTTFKCLSNGSQFKLRSRSEVSSLYYSDEEFACNIFLDLGYYEAKGLSQDGVRDKQTNEMLNE